MSWLRNRTTKDFSKLPDVALLYIAKLSHPGDVFAFSLTCKRIRRFLEPYLDKVDPHECFRCPLCDKMSTTRIVSHIAPVCACTAKNTKVYYHTPAERNYFSESDENMILIKRQCNFPGKLCLKCKGRWPNRQKCQPCNATGRVLVHRDCYRSIDEIYELYQFSDYIFV